MASALDAPAIGEDLRCVRSPVVPRRIGKAVLVAWSGWRAAPAAAWHLVVDPPTTDLSPHFAFAPSKIGSVSTSTRDFTMPCVPVLYFLKCGVCRCA
jgi:hypothetical protein